jgi:IMP dehydrogenase
MSNGLTALEGESVREEITLRSESLPSAPEIHENPHQARGIPSLEGLTFGDVLILPAKSNVRPEQVELQFEVAKGLTATTPVFAAPMGTVWSPELTCTLAEHGALAPLATELTLPQVQLALKKLLAYRIDTTKFPGAVLRGKRLPIIVASSPYDLAKLQFLRTQEVVDYILLDTAQPYSDEVIDTVRLYSTGSRPKIIVGNIVTAEAAWEFCQLNIAALKVGLGPGSICTTRAVSGVGVPQLQAIRDVAQVASRFQIPVIADGGIRELSDIAKALAAGANSVMLGRLFAGTSESPGRIISLQNGKYKVYAASRYASVELEASNTGNPEVDKALEHLEKNNHRSEGVSGLVPYVGSARTLLMSISKALQSSFAFVGAANLAEFQSRARFIRVSSLSHQEGLPHSIDIVTHRNKIF